MSERQSICFQAVDRPLNDAQLEFARQQSSRAEVTKWSLSVDYNYSSFRGNVDGLLRGGYDVYVNFVNYGIREIRLRLPGGLPFAKETWSQYLVLSSLEWTKDSKGPGGILKLCIHHEPGAFDDVWHLENYADAAAKIREHLMTGDLRALYLFWLCAANGDYDPEELREPPVPHGIADLPDCSADLLEFFGHDPLVLVAAGKGIPSVQADASADQAVKTWLASLDRVRAEEMLEHLLFGDTATEKSKLLAEFREARAPSNWPTTDRALTFQELIEQTNLLREEENAEQAQLAAAAAQRKAEKASRERAQRLQQMKQSPDQWLQEVDRLVKLKGTDNYTAAAEMLSELREAVGGDAGKQLACQRAAQLANKFPTLNLLKSALRKRQLLP